MIYHCDGYYLECSKRGTLDVNDIRQGKYGQLPRRQTCTSKGINPITDKVCYHCVELKKRKKITQRASRVRHSHVEHIPTEGDIIIAGKR
jgi:hypothetical protein